MNTTNENKATSSDDVAVKAAVLAVERINAQDKEERDELRGELMELALLKAIDVMDALLAHLQRSAPADKPSPVPTTKSAPASEAEIKAAQKARERAKIEAMRLAAAQKMVVSA